MFNEIMSEYSNLGLLWKRNIGYTFYYTYAKYNSQGTFTHTHIFIIVSAMMRVLLCIGDIIKADKNLHVPMFLFACIWPYSLLRSSAETIRPPPQQHKIIVAVRMSCCCLAMISSVGSDGVTLSVYTCVWAPCRSRFSRDGDGQHPSNDSAPAPGTANSRTYI